MLKPGDLLREVALPFTTPTVLFSFLLFFALFQIASIGFVFGFVIGAVLATQLAVFALPALLRTLTKLLESRSKGREPDPPVIEFFSWVGNIWTLFPIVHLAIFVYAFYFSAVLVGGTVAVTIAILYALVLPASLIVLSVTHSVLESLRPAALVALVQRCGPAYLAGPLFVLVAVGFVTWMNAQFNNNLLTEFVSCYLVFAAFAVFGGMVRHLNLENELDIPEAEAVLESEYQEQQSLVRAAALNHAYGLISRGNVDRGLDHLYQELADDPDAAAGWYWYFDRMMKWERSNAGLVFAQHYLHQLLEEQDNVRAVKVMLRCRLVNAQFKPLRDDIPLAIYAAKECNNEDLATLLRSQ